MNFVSSIEENCRLHPEKICVVDGQTRLTYGDMEQRASRLARVLVSLGVSPGDRVAIFQTNCFQFVEMLYAIAKVGGIIVTLNFRLTGEEAAYILNNSGSRVLLAGDRYAPMLAGIRKDLPFLEHGLCMGREFQGMMGYEKALAGASPEPFACLDRAGDDTACLIYTSGTTGRPKGAMLTHENVTSLFSEESFINAGAILVNVPMYHIAGINTAVSGLHTAQKIVYLAQFEPGLFLETIEKEAIGFTYLVPTMPRPFWTIPIFPGETFPLQNDRYGASPMPLELLLRAKRELPTDYTNYFGMTEAMGTISICSPRTTSCRERRKRLPKKTRRLSGIGRAIAEVDVRVFDDADREVPRGAVGEIVARGRKS
jgi:long-chain acyl-CoA synthetase